MLSGRATYSSSTGINSGARRKATREPSHWTRRRCSGCPTVELPGTHERLWHVVMERGDIAQDARRGNRGQVHESGERRFRGLLRTGRGIVLAKERAHRLAVVGHGDPHETRAPQTGRVTGDNIASNLAQDGNNSPPS